MVAILAGRAFNDPAMLGGAVAGLFDIRRQLWHPEQYRTAWQQNEKVLAREMVADLPTGSLILADLGYVGFAWFDLLTEAGHFWISRVRNKTSYTVIHTFYTQGETRDCLVWLGSYRADRGRHAVRLIEFRVGGTLYRYITNVLDPQQLTPHLAAELYARRWDFELAVNLEWQGRSDRGAGPGDHHHCSDRPGNTAGDRGTSRS